MSFHRVVASIVVPCFLLLAGTVAQADDDIPGTVIVDDEDALENPIAWASGADPKTLGQLESALTCDLQDGDAEGTAVAVDNATSAVVITLLKIHQANLMEHKGSEAFIKQKKDSMPDAFT